MIDFVKYVVSELKSERLSKQEALGLITEFSRRPASPGATAIHPLLHRNTSDLSQQSYAASFSGDEFFLRDHRVHGHKMLPGVAYLEMARAAACLAMPERDAAAGFELRNVAWIQPVRFPEQRDLTVALFPMEGNGDGIEVEVFSADDAVHFQGCAMFSALGAPARHELPVLAARMQRGRTDSGALYASIAAMGIELGAGHQGVKSVRRGEGELLVEIGLPDMLDDSAAQYVLHPSVLDSAIQAGMALVLERSAGQSQPPLPFALESLRVFGRCDKHMFAWVRYADGARPDASVVKLDIDLCDEAGNVRAQMLGFSSRVSASAVTPRASACLMAAPSWRQAELTAAAGGSARFGERHVWLCGMGVVDLSADGKAAFSVVGAVAGDDLGERYTQAVIDCVARVQAIVERKPQQPVLIQLVAPGGAAQQAFSGLSGLLATMTQEHPWLCGQLVLADAGADGGALRAMLAAEACGTPDPLVRYEGGMRYLRRFEALDTAHAPAGPLRNDGAYLITGGTGALGQLFARELLTRTSDAAIVLTGRGELTPAQRLVIDGLNSGAERVHYQRMDLADAGAVQRAIDAIVGRFGRIGGVLHAAGMARDSFIANKTAAEVREVCAPKVGGTVHLDRATASLDLDFMVLFSSAASAYGNAGQADYAAANGFMDGFAAWRNALAASGERKGRTVSINWPLWEAGGMAPDAASIAMLERSTGMMPMTTAHGMQAFHRSLAPGLDQLLVVEGDLERLKAALLDHDARPAAANASAPVVDADSLFEHTRELLRKEFAAVLKLAPHKIDPQARLERYGIDSILAMDLTNQLEITFGSLPKTLFFEHHTIVELTGYFVQTHAARLATMFSAPAGQASKLVPPPAASADTVATPVTRRRLRRGAAAAPAHAARDPIAIVGLSGRYPEAPDLAAFWANLRDGKDCIVEVPKERWDWRDYYSEERSGEGKHFSKWGGFISGADEFDPLFFGIAPVGAELIDPQERMFLQHAWMALEDAGYTRDSLQVAHAGGQAGQVGVYVGVMYGEYQLFGAESSLQGKRMGIPTSYASIANRVSYILNLHGPSMTLDSMCSSSLTAIHLACQDLKQGRTDLAIAGGVNLTIHPNKYLILSAGQFISSDGHCQSFGEGGDGYIPGEGVGAVMLKRLSDAQRDGNHIYGVIKGSALNHGGRTNGYSVPNPKSQAAVIDMALQECGIDARHVGYIEAHGTGTRLGDPIEIAALSQVFRKYSDDKQFCAIGSAKSNIGHCESAAGIAGLTKVLLQMKHGMIVPSLHSASLNPHIDFAASPFVVNQALRAWDRPLVDGKPMPRVAGISSFGAGGSNAHLIVQEYEAPQAGEKAESGEVLIALSARTPAQLQQKVADLLDFARRQGNGIDLEAMAYTLQTGREPMAVRLAFVAASAAQLEEKLAACGPDGQGADQGFYGIVDHERDGVSMLADDEDMLEAVDKWIARRKLAKLADLWVRGMDLDWRKLYGPRTPALVSLPAYPFARDRYWVDVKPGGALQTGAAPLLHPMLHTNTSDFFQQSYGARFHGAEPFLADHQIAMGAARRAILPGVAYLEMARAAVTFALPATAAASRVEIRNVAWAQPVVVDGATDVALFLDCESERLVDFDVRSAHADGGEPVIHCQGQVELSPAAPASLLDIAALESQMDQGAVAPERLYEAFAAMGMHYGPSFRCVTAIRKGERQLLAELAMREAVGQDSGMLPAGLLDSALQAALGLAGDLAGLPHQPSVPFALDSIVMHRPCSARMLAWVRHASGERPAGGITKVDIDLCDQDGNVCISLAGLASRTLDTRAGEGKSGLLMARPVWEEAPPATGALAHARHVVLLCGLPDLALEQLESELEGVEASHAASGDEPCGPRYQSIALACLKQLQALLKTASAEKILFQLVVAEGGDGMLLAGLSGMIGTARLENPNLAGQLVLTGAGVDAVKLASQLRAAAAQGDDVLSRHANGAPKVLRWEPLEAGGAVPSAFRDGGVYLITGGLGGLGRLFAREVLSTTGSAVVVLTGRAPHDAAIDAALAELGGAEAGRLAYRQLDLNRLDQAQTLLASVAGEFGGLHGVIHSAGMNSDSFIIHKEAADAAAVLEPKVGGTVNLDLASAGLQLDFMVLFSSLASALGNIGQADYAAANGFLDQFAAYRNEMVAQGSRHGRTVSVNWPLWQEGGMRIDAATLELMAATSGMHPLQTASGMQAFHRAVALELPQVLAVEGDEAKLLRALHKRHDVAVPPTVAQADGGMLEHMQAYLVEQFASLLKMPVHEVDPRAPLENYGMDSVLAMKLTSQLERTFGSLSKTLLFEHQTLASLAGYMAAAFPAVLRESASGRAAPSPAIQVAALPGLLKRKTTRAQAPAGQRDVAIVGVGGRYPQAKDLGQFWDNLKNGRDCVTEIPRARWDHEPFFHASRNQPGKTYSKWGGFLDGVDQFDALFFSISPKEAELIDPQERLFIETVWETIEDAGYSKESIARSRVGVYVGVMWGQYELYGAASGGAGVPSSSFASIANRVSYFFNFQGPSMALDTMCSSSLTAIHLAAEAVRSGAVDAAIAGGVNLTIHPSKYLSLSQGNFASTDGRCRSFGAGGDGYVPGEGVGAVVLKPLDQALRDGDQVYGVIKASSINHGGKTNGYTVPNPLAQSALITAALDQAGLGPDGIDYVETHGTGTSLGDPLEIAGLTQGFAAAARQGQPRAKQSCPIGSVKSNIGHLESAAGIAALTKVLLQFKHQQLAPSLHADEPNPNIDFKNSLFHVQTALQAWLKPPGRARRAAVSSFGAGGANAHLIVEDFVQERRQAAGKPVPQAFLLSARSQASLKAYAGSMAAMLEQSPAASLADIAFTSQVGRTPMQERLVVIADTVAELAARLRQWQIGETAGEGIWQGTAKATLADAGAKAALDQADLAALARLWVGGVQVDWERLRRPQPGGRVSLPTYPFAKERFWIEAGHGMRTMGATMHEPQMLYYDTEWRTSALAAGHADSQPMLVLGAGDGLLAQLRQLAGPADVATRSGGQTLPASIVLCTDGTGEGGEQAIFTLHALCQDIMRQKPQAPVRIVCLQQAPGAQSPYHRALAGYLKSLVLENPLFAWKLVSHQDQADAAHAALAELHDAQWRNGEIRYRGKRREARELAAFVPAASAAKGMAVKQNGVYIVTGGLGGLGYIVSQYLARQFGARLVLSGRSAPDAARLDALKALGGDAIYVQADVAVREQADGLVRAAREAFSEVNGIVHSAGINRDGFILNKPRAEIEAVLAAKVAGTINLDLASRAEKLDLFVLFSSLAGALGNVGQGDYAYANNFMDAYAEQRDGPGQSLSINWPFWLEGGMHIAAADLEQVAKRSGILPLPTDTGIRYFESLIGSGRRQGMALYGNGGAIAAHLERASAAPSQLAARPLQAASGGALLEATAGYLKTLLGEQIKLAVDRIDSEERFESFGVDSMMISRMNADLERDLGALPKTLFYEYGTVAELAAYLAAHAQGALERLLGIGPADLAPAATPAPAAPPTRSSAPEPIAIIGVHGQFPGSTSLEQYWRHLRAGRDLIAEVPRERWDMDALFDAEPANARQGKIYCKWGGFIDDADKFDAAFFGIGAEDARLIDPQERLFIQSVWSAVEDAGYTRDSLKLRHPKAGSADVGVFVGVTTNSYHLLTPQEWERGNMVTPGAMPWSIANRVSYFFNFQGPSLPVDTACSSSLVALHLACESIRRNECQVAVAGGVNLYLHPAKYQSLCGKGMLAVDGKCRSFGAGGDGFIPGEGIASFLLKPLARAIADGDHVYGVIEASACEHSGRSNGYSAPNPGSQARLMQQVLGQAGIGAADIGYVEGHGTGTQMGDSLEVAALSQAFGKQGLETGSCPLGSVKANVGHAESAAGVAGVAKILMQFRHKEIAPTIHAEVANPAIDFAGSPFGLQLALAPWTVAPGGQRRAMINSFGAGGVNACMVLREFEPAVADLSPKASGPVLVILSARDPERLRESAGALRQQALEGVDMERLSYTLQVGREAMPERLAIVAADADQLAAALSSYLDGAADEVQVGRVEPHGRGKSSRQEQIERAKVLFDGGDLAALGRMWVEGQAIDWESMYSGRCVVRLPLPTYPFAKERYWVSDALPATAPAPRPAPAVARLHPLVSHNASTLREVRFASSLSGADYYGRDHKVGTEMFFPGAGFLEIACASGSIAGEAAVTRIEDIVWNQPLRLAGGEQRVQTFLKSNGNAAEFVIVSYNDEHEPVVHSEGRVFYDAGPASGEQRASYPVYELMAKAQRTLEGADCYRQLAAFGLNYGPCFQTIEQMYVGEGFALARLVLAAELRDSFDQYILHPCLVDGALQSVIGIAQGGEEDTPYLPFALDEVEIVRPLSDICYAYVEQAAGGAGPDIRQFNIRLLSEYGEVLARLNNFYVRAMRSGQPTQAEQANSLMLSE